jgi:hypothetical protein
MGSLKRKLRNNGLDMIFSQIHRELRGRGLKRSDKKKILGFDLVVIACMQEGLMYLHKTKRVRYNPFDSLGDY